LVNKKQEELKNLIIKKALDQNRIVGRAGKIKNMNNKAAKKLRRLAIAIAAANGKIEDSERIYKNLKTVHKENKKAPQN
jgi:tellurite resistance protein